MIKKWMFLMAVMTVTIGRAQVAKWIIPPVYEAIHMAEGSDLILADSVGETILWTVDGKRLSSTAGRMAPYRGGLSVTTKKGKITGFFDEKGHFTSLPGYGVAYASPFFSGGSLLVRDGEYFRFVDSQGKAGEEKYILAYPFCNGYAACYTYRDFERYRDSYHFLLTKGGERVQLSYGGKVFDDNDIEFISSVNDEQLGVVVAKRKLFFFNGKTGKMTPVYAKEAEQNVKNQAKLGGEVAACYEQETDSTTRLVAKCGKTDYVAVRFDVLLRPVAFITPDGVKTYERRAVPQRALTSPLRRVVDGSLVGLSWENVEILPPQLEEVGDCFGDKAFVKMDGKYGMLRAWKDEHFGVIINKGNAVAFRHQKFETMIRVNLPHGISAHRTQIKMDAKTGCMVDMTSVEKHDTEAGNFVSYNCVLNIPDSLPDGIGEGPANDITYPLQMVYNGLVSPVIPLKVKAWHYKYFNVDVINGETSVSQGDLSFSFNINAERNPGEDVYPTSVDIQTDSLMCELEKISETRYKCKVFGLRNGVNNLVVRILEQGCPPASFPLEITYTKPTPQRKNKSAIKENVAIKKKAKKTQGAMVRKPILESL